jgi:hypothetical protein
VSFPSVLYAHHADRPVPGPSSTPAFFTDLGLDQIVAAVLKGKEEYELEKYYREPLTSADAILYRQAALHDIERPGLQAKLAIFAQRMHTMRERLLQVEKRHNPIQRWRWFLDIVFQYCQTIRTLADHLQGADLQSLAFSKMREHVLDFAASDRFIKLTEESRSITDQLAALRYNILIDGLHVTINPPGGEPDYGREVQAAFANFQSPTNKTFDFERDASLDVDGVEARILEKVAGLYPEPFVALMNFFEAHQVFRDPAIDAFDREVQFYISYLAYIAPLKKAGLHFCYPTPSETDQAETVENSFDVALATKLQRNHALPITNDYHLAGPERIIVVSGPNQGGKTTFARTFGQLHYLGALGLPVAATTATLFVPHKYFTHFERTERMTSLRGKLQDDLIRVHEILAAATPKSLIIINEIFASTTLADALFLSRKIGGTIIDLDVLCVWVTFIEEVASLGKSVVSMVSAVEADNPERRTFKILRQPANGLAYAMSIARKYRLTRDAVKERIQ